MHCHTEFSIDVNGPTPFVNISSSVCLQFLKCHGLHFSACKFCKVLLKLPRCIDMDLYLDKQQSCKQQFLQR